jgi:hypothetical protein
MFPHGSLQVGDRRFDHREAGCAWGSLQCPGKSGSGGEADNFHAEIVQLETAAW